MDEKPVEQGGVMSVCVPVGRIERRCEDGIDSEEMESILSSDDTEDIREGDGSNYSDIDNSDRGSIDGDRHTDIPTPTRSKLLMSSSSIDSYQPDCEAQLDDALHELSGEKTCDRRGTGKITRHFHAFTQALRDYISHRYPKRLEKALKRIRSSVWKRMDLNEKYLFTKENLGTDVCKAILKRYMDDENLSELSDAVSDDSGRTSKYEVAEEPRNELYWSPQRRMCYILKRPEEPTVGPSLNDVVNLVPVDCRALEYKEVTDRRGNIIMFEESYAELMDDPESSDFALAMAFLSEWDDPGSNSYEWRPVVLDLIQHPEQWKKWRKEAEECHPVLQRLLMERRGRYMFALCVSLLGWESEVLSLLDGLEDALPQPNNAMSTHTTMIDAISVDPIQSCLMTLIAGVRSTAQGVEDKDFKRHSSRVGSSFQVEVSPFVAPSETEDEDKSVTSGLVYRPDVVLDSVENAYLSEAYACLPIRPGLLVDTVKPSISSVTGSSTPSGQTSHAWKENVPQQERQKSTQLAASANRRRLYVVMDVREDGKSTVSAPDETIGSAALNQSFSSSESIPSGGDETVLHSASDRASSPVTTRRLVASVRNGREAFAVPTSECRARFYHEDRALEVLHYCNYDCQQALKYVRDTVANSVSSSFGTAWPVQLLQSFFEVSSHPTDSIRDVYCSLRKIFSNSGDLESAFDSSENLQHQVKMKDVINMYYCLYPDREQCDLVATATPVKRRSQRAIAPSSDSRISYTQVLEGVPNRWPSGLKFTPHNIYWVKNKGCPCICTSLEINPKETTKLTGGAALHVLPFRCDIPYKSEIVSASSLTPMTEGIAAKMHDSRTADFALAMMDIAEMELTMYPKCKWYIYPEFIMELIYSGTKWLSWRRRAEKGRTGSGTPRHQESRRSKYFNALYEEYKERVDSDSRCMDAEYPWDDGIMVPVPPPSPEEKPPISSVPVPVIKKRKVSRGAEEKESKRPSKTVDSLVSATSPPDAEKQKKSLVSDSAKLVKKGPGRRKKISESDIKPALQPPPKPLPTRWCNKSNLFWSNKMGLPVMFYDTPGNDKKNTFKVQPINAMCHTYFVDISFREVEPLTLSNLKGCYDQRTRDFAEALLQFYEWDINRCKTADLIQQTDCDTASDIVPSCPSMLPTEDKSEPSMLPSLDPNVSGDEDEPYAWPDFILDLVAHNSSWRPWSRSVERSMAKTGKANVRVIAYVNKLKEQYLEELSMFDDDSSEDEASCTSAMAPKNADSEQIYVKNEQSGSIHNPVTVSDSVSIVSVPSSTAHMSVNPTNLFWLTKRCMPAIFYGYEGEERNESFFVFPISLSERRVQIEERRCDMEPLTMKVLNEYDDERSCDFCHGLLALYEWVQHHGDESQDNKDKVPFVWPDIVLDVVTHSEGGLSWRRGVERRVTRSYHRAQAYTDALLEEYRANVLGIASDDGEIESKYDDSDKPESRSDAASLGAKDRCLKDDITRGPSVGTHPVESRKESNALRTCYNSVECDKLPNVVEPEEASRCVPSDLEQHGSWATCGGALTTQQLDQPSIAECAIESVVNGATVQGDTSLCELGEGTIAENSNILQVGVSDTTTCGQKRGDRADINDDGPTCKAQRVVE